MSYLLAYNPYNTNLFMRSRSIDPAALAYFNATGISGSIEQQAINTLVEGLKADGLWSKMKAVYPFVTDNRNLLGYTEDLTNALWNKGGATVIANNALAPDGSNTAWRVTRINSALQGFALRQNVPITSGVVCTFSVYLKAPNSSTTIQLDLGDSVPNPIITLTTEWQLYTFVRTTGPGGGFIDFNLGPGDGSFCWFWHPQLELGSTATTYQPIATTQQAFISSQFKYNLVNPVDSDAAFRLVFNGGWTHSSNGATPNGTNGYADTKLVPSSVLTLNSTSHSVYSRSLSPIGMMGGVNDANYLILNNPTSTTIASQLNSISTNLITGNIVNSQGLLMANRVDSLNINIWRNSTKVASDSKASTGLPLIPYYISGRNNGGTPANYDSKQYAFYHLGDGLTDTEAANLYTRVQAFQTQLSRQVP